MKLLAFETATEACSVALWLDGEVIERFEIAPRRHAELSLPWADALLADAGIARSQLDAIAVGRGPGAFTGVRLAIAIAQGVALGLDRPLVPVSTLAALALPSLRDDPGARVLTAIDARMNELYIAAFHSEQGRITPLMPERLATATGVDIEGDGWLGVGTGFAAQDGLLATRLAQHFARIDNGALPHAADVVRIAAADFADGGGLSPELVEPAYLRNNVALTLVEQQVLRDSRK